MATQLQQCYRTFYVYFYNLDGQQHRNKCSTFQRSPFNNTIPMKQLETRVKLSAPNHRIVFRKRLFLIYSYCTIIGLVSNELSLSGHILIWASVLFFFHVYFSLCFALRSYRSLRRVHGLISCKMQSRNKITTKVTKWTMDEFEHIVTVIAFGNIDNFACVKVMKYYA